MPNDDATPFFVPEHLAASWRASPQGSVWLDGLPRTVREVRRRWSLRLGAPFEGDEISAAWVAPARRADGTKAVLKVGLPHMEADHEIDGLRFWDGDPTVLLLEGDPRLNAMLLERCEPGTALRSLPEEDQDVVIAGLLRRLWRAPAPPHPFRPLAVMIDDWAEETRANEHRWPDAGIVREGLRVFGELAQPAAGAVLLATDLHAGNVLAARREPWLAIDPKPFVGDPAYDATQHLLNSLGRLRRDPVGTITRFADLLEIDADRVRRWTFARVAAETRDDWNEGWPALARSIGV